MTSLLELNDFTRQVQQLMEAHRPFSVHQERGKLTIAPERVSSVAQALKTSDGLVNAALERLKKCNLKLLSAGEREAVRDLVDVAYRYIREQSKKYTSIGDKAAWDHLQALALSVKLGGRLSATLLESPHFKDFSTFIQVNYLHHKVQALHQQLEFLPGVMVEGRSVVWYSMNRRDMLNAAGEKVGYIFS